MRKLEFPKEKGIQPEWWKDTVSFDSSYRTAEVELMRPFAKGISDHYAERERAMEAHIKELLDAVKAKREEDERRELVQQAQVKQFAFLLSFHLVKE